MNDIYVFPLVGFHPISHMGHFYDLSKVVPKDGNIHLGMTNGFYSFEERKNIFNRQWIGYNINCHEVKSVGDTLKLAYFSEYYPKKINIIVGHDREKFGDRIIDSLENDKFPELEGRIFNAMELIVLDDRKHDLSGTQMRIAANENNRKRFKEHIGPMFKDEEIDFHMERIRNGINDKKLNIYRK